MRRGGSLAVVVTLLAAGAGLAAFKPGSYSGKTARGGAVSFMASGAQVTNFRFAATQRCDGGRTVQSTVTVNRMPIRNGRFRATSPAVVTGELTGSTARGTLSFEQARVGTARNCRTGRIAWNARRGAAAGGYPCTVDAAFNGGDLQVDAACTTDFDAFVVRVPRMATRADTSTAHLRCLAGTTSGPSYSGPMVNCSAQDGVRLKSGRVLIRFDTPAGCTDADAARVTFLRSLESESDPFRLKTLGC